MNAIPVPTLPVPAPKRHYEVTIKIDVTASILDSDDEEFDDNVKQAVKAQEKAEERKYQEKSQYTYRRGPHNYGRYQGKYYRLHQQRRFNRRPQRQVSDAEYLRNIRGCVPREEPSCTISNAPKVQSYQPMLGSPEERYKRFCEWRASQLRALEEWKKGPQDPRERPFVPIAQTFEEFMKD